MQTRNNKSFVIIRNTCVFAAALALVAPALTDDDVGERFTVIKAGRIITLSGKEITNGLIILADGKIHSVGKSIEYPRNAKVIDASDQVVMPGLIDPHTRFAMPGYNRSGVHADLTVADEYVARENQWEDLLAAGYTAVAIVPTGRGIPGRALVLRTGGDNDERELLNPGYIRINGSKGDLRSALEKAQAEIDKADKAREAFDEKQKKKPEPQSKPTKEAKPTSRPTSQPTTAPTSQPVFEAPKIAPAIQPLVDLLRKEEGLFALIEFNRASDLLHIEQVLKQHEIAHHFLVRNRTQSDLEHVVQILGDKETRLILYPRNHRVPYSAERINLVGALSKAGCELSFVPTRDTAQGHSQMFKRLAELVRTGLPRETALKAVTLFPARLLGLEERFGTIEKDKDADLIFLDADPLAPDARVQKVMIAGKVVYTREGN